jgi:TP901 family phage tail tape measure protein
MREVEARLKLSAVDRTAKAFDAVSRRLNDVQRKTGAVNRAQAALERSAGASMLAVGRVLGPAALAYGGTRAIKDFALFERQMSRIGITAGITVEETKKAGEALQGLATQTALPLESVMAGLDTLVASGQSLEEAMAFLPAVLNTAQATGAATEDIANTALKSASALGLQASEMQDAFDIMVAGGKAGQFELKDMAAYIPGLANSFATLGYSGQDGLKQLIALLQTIREDTGSAEAAATQAQNIFGKMYAGQTATAFKKFGIDLRKEMEAAKASGEGAVDAFVRLSKEAVKGDLTKLPLLFTDQEFRLGMQSMMTSTDSVKRFLEIMNGAQVQGTVGRDVKRIADDVEGSIQRMSTSLDTLMKSVGGVIATPAADVMDNLSSGIDNAPKADAIRKARGDSSIYRTLNYASGPADAALIAEYEAYDRMQDPGTAEQVGMNARRNYAGRGFLDAQKPSRTGTPAPIFRDAPVAAAAPEPVAVSTARTAPLISARQAEASSMQAMRGQYGAMLAPSGSSFQKGVTGQDVIDEVDTSALKAAMEAGGAAVAQGGDQAKASIEAGGQTMSASLSAAIATAFGVGGAQVAAAIRAALAAGVKVNVNGAVTAPSGRSLGTSMPDAGN